MKKVPDTTDRWRKSSRSAQETDCIEVHPDGAIRDSKNPAGPVLGLPWAGLVAAVKTGQITR